MRRVLLAFETRAVVRIMTQEKESRREPARLFGQNY